MSRDRALPASVRRFIALAAASGSAVLAWRLVDHGGWAGADAVGFAVMLGGSLLAHRLLITIRYRTETDNFDLTDAIFTAGILLVAPGPMLAGVAIGLTAAQIWRRLAWHKIAFNTGQYVLGLGLASVVYQRIASEGMTHRAWIAAVAGMAVFFVVNQAAVAEIISLVERIPVSSVVQPALSLSALYWAGNVALGLLGALMWQHDRAGLPLLAVPVGLAHLAYRSWLRATQEREQMLRMTTAAADISLDTDLTRRIPETGETPELTSLAAALNRMLARLEAAFLRERRFIREASHELRTPLTVTRGYLEVLGTNPSEAELREAIEVSLDELDRMGRLVTDLTTLATSEDVGFVRPGSFNLGDFLDKLESKARPILDGRLRISGGHRDAMVGADPQRLTQALLNLMTNAAAHASGSGLVTLTVVAEPSHWKFEVSDDGGGLPSGSEDLVFQPFHRASGAGPGSGLGLAIVKGIAEAHAGVAGVDNRPGEGATFWIRVPRGDR